MAYHGPPFTNHVGENMRAAIFLIGAIGLGSPAAAQQAVTFTTESYPPFSYRDTDGAYRGATVEQVETAMRAAGISFTLEIMPWARAIALAEMQPMHCVFAAARTTEREPRFKWITPLSVDRTFLVRNTLSNVSAHSIEEARQYMIGTHRSDFTEEILRWLDFPVVDLSTDFAVTLNKLMEQRIDMMPISESVYETLKSEGRPLEKVIQLTRQEFGIACNRTMPDQVVKAMQNGLDSVINDGQQDTIRAKYGLHPLGLRAK